MKARVSGLLLLACLQSASQWQQTAAATTCPFNIQSSVASTLENPETEYVITGSSSSTSGSIDSSGSDTSSGTGSSSEVEAPTSSNDGTGSTITDGSAGVTTTPSTTSSTPSTTSPTSSGSEADTPSTTTQTPTTTTATPTTTTATPSTSSTAGSSTDDVSAGTRRNLQTTTTTTPTTTTATPSTTTTTPSTTTATPSTTTATPSTTTTTPSTTTSPTTASSGSTTNTVSASSSGSGSSTTESFVCDETFYSKWSTLGITCGTDTFDVDSAVSASSCVIYSGELGKLDGSSCVSICSFPACTNGAWVYSGVNGLGSSVYANVSLQSFLTSTMIADLPSRTDASAEILANMTMVSDEQCAYSSEDSFSSCTCSALIVNGTSSQIDEAKKEKKTEDKANGVITEDDTSLAGNVLAPTSSSVAGVAVVVSTIGAVASSIVSSTSAATASAATAGNVAVATLEICQFGVFLNQLDLEGKSAALALYGKKMGPTAFVFLPFGKLDDESSSSSSRRLTDATQPDSGIATYSRTLGIDEDMLFVVTLAGVICVMAGIVGLFGLCYILSGLFMNRDDFMTKFYDKMIGVEVMVAILSQYTIGVTATYQIYRSVDLDDATNPKCILAAVSLIFLACGVLLYGYIIVKKHEHEMADVGTAAHVKKAVNMRYGALYDEYKYKNRYFFAAKMMVALVTGCATGFVGLSSTVQVSIALGVHVLFFFYLEVQSPHHSKFLQTATSFVTIMKIAVLVLTFFLISAATSDGFPDELQNGISLAIVGLNLFVLVLLMVRSLYAFWKKYQLQRDAQYDQEEQTAQDYFKDETPGRTGKDRVPAVPAQASMNPYMNDTNQLQPVDYEDGGEIRLRSATHLKDNMGQSNYEDQNTAYYDNTRRTATNHYVGDDRVANYSQRRNDVVEL